MVSSESPADHSSQPDPPGLETGANQRVRTLQICFCCAVVLLAIFQFSENTVDVDLWGHVIFGQAMLKAQAIPKTEIYSWTATGQPWVSHECLAEIILGGTHALLGGKGLLLLKFGIGILNFAITLRLGLANLAWPQKFIAWGVGALAVVELSYGFAARPQIFTVLFLVLELVLLVRIHAGALLWALAVPVIFVIWINTHGGVLAGFGLLGLAASATTAQSLFRKFRPALHPASGHPLPSSDEGSRYSVHTTQVFSLPGVTAKNIVVLWLTVLASGAALFVNPWKSELVRWLIGSVLWLRPEIEEWNPTPLGWDHGALFALVLLAAFAWIFTRRLRAWWQVAACAAFSLLALRSVRNAPLCAVVILALVPPHLASALVRFRNAFARFEEMGRNAGFQKSAIALLAAAGLGIGIATFTLHKENPFTMEIPSAQYPNGAVAFLRDHKLNGKMLVFFDWGEMVIFHLPDCPPSIDGRLDACYSRELIATHWKFYSGEPFDQKILNPDEADLALLPASLAGAGALAKRPDWKPVYYDQTAVILARNWERFPQLAGLTLPVEGPKIIGLGRVAFLDNSPRWK